MKILSMVMVRVCSLTLPVRVKLCHLLMIFANSLDPSDSVPERIF